MTKRFERLNGELVPDDGSATERPRSFSIIADIKGLRRTASNGPPIFSRAHNESEIRTFAAINGTIDLKGRLTVVNADGTAQEWREPLNVSIVSDWNEGDPLGEVACHPYRLQSEPVREVMVSVNLPKERFDWLWNKIGELPDAVVSIDFRTNAWQTDADYHFGLADEIPTLTLDRDQISNVEAVTFYLNEKPRPETVMVENEKGELVTPPAYALDPKIVRYLGWTVVLLVALLIVTMAKP